MRTRHRVWVFGDHINTDVIFPGKYTYTLRTPEAIASKALEDIDPSFADHVQFGDVIVAGKNWGCGSSREQAVTAPKYCGIVAIIAASFSGLYYRNCINQGIRPVICPELHKVVRTNDIIEMDYDAGLIRANGSNFTLRPLPQSIQQIIDSGGLLPMLQARFQAVDS